MEDKANQLKESIKVFVDELKRSLMALEYDPDHVGPHISPTLTLDDYKNVVNNLIQRLNRLMGGERWYDKKLNELRTAKHRDEDLAHAVGYEEGWNKGYDEGYQNGFDNGFHDGYDQGYMIRQQEESRYD